ncbi:MAG: TetR/AcrR family transcriptional regulator [Chloroflexota bacterium]|nr:TetR/AcrR family transcriptional regulator [Chloroflexota bacterium]
MDNRDNLLKAALDLFTRNGYDAVGVQTICDAAGIKKPTLYHYFGSKNGLLTTLLAEGLEPFMANLEIAADYQHDVTNSLFQVAQTYFQFARQHPRIYRFYLSNWFAPRDSEAFKAVQPFNDRQQSLLENLFAAAALDHGNMQGRQRTYAASFLGMVNTYVMLALNGYADLDEDFVRRLLHQFMHGIFS